MNKRLLAAVFIAGIFCIAFFSGCVNRHDVPSQSNELSAKEVLDKSFKVSAETNNYSYLMTMKASMMEGAYAGVAMEVMRVEGRVDKSNKRMHLSAVYPLTPAQNSETYIIGGAYYRSLPDSGWTRGEAENGSLWEQESIQDMQGEIMKSSLAAFLPEEKLNGVDCYVLNVTPDMSKLSALTGKNANLQEQAINSIIFASIKEWADKDSFLMRKVLFRIDVNESGKIMRMETDLSFFDYGAEQAIELPPEAKNARAA
jgi:hypothetical protein